MADALIGIVIENLGSFVREEIASFLGVGELTHKQNENLTTIRALSRIHNILKDAEKKQITSNVVKQWLQKLGDAAYVLDDILDECSITSKAHEGNKCITRFHPMKILARRNIGKRMKEVAKRIDDIAEERKKFGFQSVGVTEEHQRGDDEWILTTSAVTEPKVYGRDKDKEQIVEFLIGHASNSEELSVYSIVGVGGQGKTTLAQVVYNDERVQEILQNKRYLLVLDDVWSDDQVKWNTFKSLLPNGKKGASILVTTRLEIVASIMGTKVHPLAQLSDDDIWSLFKQHAFGANREGRAELVEIGQKLVRKCVGSPLAAKRLPPLGKLPCLTTLYVSGIRDVKYIDDDMYEGATKKAFPSLKEMSLRNLPNLERVLKAEGVEMLSQLYNLIINVNSKLAFPSLQSVKFLCAIGETDFNDDGASFLRVIAASLNNLEELFIQKFDELKVLPNELNSLSSLQKLLISFCPKLESVPQCVLQGLSSLRVLSFTYCKSLISLPQSTTNLTCLETLQIAYCPNLVLPANMNMLSSLREVRIISEDKTGILPNGLEGIPCLQNLQLYDCSSLASLPHWLGAMTSLQTLEIKRFPKLTSLPNSFKELINLKELRISNCPMLMNRCKKETGEDWHKIAHIPRLELKFDVEP
ncbi:putative disease resistance protein RGA4 [Medicago truncatula]|uniref:putative disease resistance protein RGA4 n=1 Tax=Medicago truncatula TaxID=3880 RepID=UPI001968359F|nr:putative disease resistance protein RGA4 [Medicago truncatula]